MSEYQYYEFQAIDRALAEREMRALRSYSTRATITPTCFVNHYSWGDFKGVPSAWMEKYFDAFLYLANWGTHEIMLRLPRRVLDLETAKRYCRGESASASAKGGFVILDFHSESEDGGGWNEDGSGRLSSLIPLRGDIAGGDYRALYLGWLLCAQEEELDDRQTEPPVPPGLGTLTAPLKAFADFLRIDGDLLAVAAQRSSRPGDMTHGEDLRRWIAALPEAKKMDLLVRLAAGGERHLRGELLRGFRSTRHAGHAGRPKPRTAPELLADAARHAEERRREEAERAAREKAIHQRKEAKARGRYLDGLARREPETWRKVEALVATKKPADYDEAVKLLRDLRDLCARQARVVEAEKRIQDLRERHARKPTFVVRLEKAGLAAPIS